MYNFFAEESARDGGFVYITGADYNHIKNVLRMRVDEAFYVSIGGVGSLCRLVRYEGETVVCEIVRERCLDTNLPIRIVLFQGLPKSDKMELIIQKAVELGVSEIVPVEMHRCVVKLDEKKKMAKRVRWQAIAESAAKQSKRSVIPEVFNVLPYKAAMEKASAMDVLLVPYENKDGMAATKDALEKIRPGMTVGILIGAEGGFEEKEIDAVTDVGGLTISLGKRILRTETAAITAVGMCMLHAEMFLSEGGQC